MLACANYDLIVSREGAELLATKLCNQVRSDRAQLRLEETTNDEL